jgi:cold shock CspA family protein/ribosome-associated translation inhibitor RaiA
MEIHWHHVGTTLRSEERAAIEERLRALAAGHDDLIDIRISGRESGHHRHGEKEVRIVCQARGKELVAARSRPDLGLALHEALDAFEREVHRLRERRRDLGLERPSEPPLLGIVDRVFRADGYGFLLTDAGDRVYFHRNAVKAGLDFARLEEGDRVALNLEPGREGLQATSVVAPPPGTPSP